MKDLSFTREYLMCVLTEKGNIQAMKSPEIQTCLVVGGILELLIDGYISLDAKKKITITKDIDEKTSYLQPLYDTINESKSITVKVLTEKYIFSSNKRFNTLLYSIGESLAENNAVLVKKESGVLHEKTYFIPNKNEVTKIIEKIRAEFLEENDLTDETVILAALLNKSGLIKNYFSKFEADKLKERLTEIKNDGVSALIKEIMDYIDYIETMIALL